MKGAYTTLVKRELWEYRWLWVAPLVAAGLLICMTVFASLSVSISELRVTPQLQAEISGMHNGLSNLSAELFLVSILVMAFYLLDCLYAERKDRSILFWKSLPVSDFQTVASKLCVGLVLLPLGTFVLATLIYPITYAVSAVAWPGFTGLIGGWDMGDWLRAELWLLGCMVATILWYAPLAAWFMLTSVLSSRSPYFLIGMPVAVLGVCENFLLHSGHVWRFFRWRVLPVNDFAEGMQRPDLWIGLAAAAGMLYIVVRLRRYRDDT